MHATGHGVACYRLGENLRRLLTQPVDQRTLKVPSDDTVVASRFLERLSVVPPEPGFAEHVAGSAAVFDHRFEVVLAGGSGMPS